MFEPTIAEWHEQFERQAKWTQMTRSMLYRRANLLRTRRILDVGCGTGVLTNELVRRTRGIVVGLDKNPDMLAYARRQTSRIRYEKGDALDLPYPDGHFDAVTCHFVLLWLSDPAQAVDEMARVVRRGGHVLICAEPDYGGRLDWPDFPIREWQIEGLRRQGANPFIGRQIRHLLAEAGLRPDVSVLPSHWDAQQLIDNFENEWRWIEYDVGDAVDQVTFERVKKQAWTAISEGLRLVYVPTFCAFARK
jgi:ubiquinone/menaquinone biosynthesis C-methylase UbiE